MVFYKLQDIQGRYPLKPLIITLTLPLPSKGEDYGDGVKIYGFLSKKSI